MRFKELLENKNNIRIIPKKPTNYNKDDKVGNLVAYFAGNIFIGNYKSKMHGQMKKGVKKSEIIYVFEWDAAGLSKLFNKKIKVGKYTNDKTDFSNLDSLYGIINSGRIAQDLNNYSRLNNLNINFLGKN